MGHLFKTGLFTGLFLFLCSTQAFSKGMPIFFQTGSEIVSKAQELPDTENFQFEDGSYFDLGAYRKQFTIFFIPLWNYDVEWCAYLGTDDEMMSLTKEQLDAIAADAGLTLAETPPLPFWSSIGGKLLFLAIIGGFIAFSVMKSNDDEEPTDEEGKVVAKYGPAQETAPLTETPILPNNDDPQTPKL